MRKNKLLKKLILSSLSFCFFNLGSINNSSCQLIKNDISNYRLANNVKLESNLPSINDFKFVDLSAIIDSSSPYKNSHKIARYTIQGGMIQSKYESDFYAPSDYINTPLYNVKTYFNNNSINEYYHSPSKEIVIKGIVFLLKSSDFATPGRGDVMVLKEIKHSIGSNSLSFEEFFDYDYILFGTEDSSITINYKGIDNNFYKDYLDNKLFNFNFHVDDSTDYILDFISNNILVWLAQTGLNPDYLSIPRWTGPIFDSSYGGTFPIVRYQYIDSESRLQSFDFLTYDRTANKTDTTTLNDLSDSILIDSDIGVSSSDVINSYFTNNLSIYNSFEYEDCEEVILSEGKTNLKIKLFDRFGNSRSINLILDCTSKAPQINLIGGSNIIDVKYGSSCNVDMIIDCIDVRCYDGTPIDKSLIKFDKSIDLSKLGTTYYVLSVQDPNNHIVGQKRIQINVISSNLPIFFLSGNYVVYSLNKPLTYENINSIISLIENNSVDNMSNLNITNLDDYLEDPSSISNIYYEYSDVNQNLYRKNIQLRGIDEIISDKVTSTLDKINASLSNHFESYYHYVLFEHGFQWSNIGYYILYFVLFGWIWMPFTNLLK